MKIIKIVIERTHFSHIVTTDLIVTRFGNVLTKMTGFDRSAAVVNGRVY